MDSRCKHRSLSQNSTRCTLDNKMANKDVYSISSDACTDKMPICCCDTTEHFKDTSVMNSSLLFTIINERGDKEEGVIVGVEREKCIHCFGNNLPTQ